MKKNFEITLAIIFIGVGLCLAQSEQPSLGELAKKNKAAHKEVKVFTEADVPGSGANATAAAAAAQTPQTSTIDSTPTSVAATAKKENPQESAPGSKDSTSVTELKKQIDSYQQERDNWKKSVKRYEDLLANESNEFRRQMYQDAIANDKQNVAFYQQKVDQTQADLAKAEKASSTTH